jgi:hypothetical protein
VLLFSWKSKAIDKEITFSIIVLRKILTIKANYLHLFLEFYSSTSLRVAKKIPKLDPSKSLTVTFYNSLDILRRLVTHPKR